MSAPPRWEAGEAAASHDLLIVGGGPAGLATAIAARDAGLDVCVIERSGYDGPRIGEHIGSSAVPALARLGLAPLLHPPHAHPCVSVASTWAEDTEQEHHALFHPHGEGWLLARPGFDVALAHEAEARGATVLRRSWLSGCHREGARWRLELHTATGSVATEADFLIDATGRTASLARRLGVRSLSYDRLVGITAFLPLNASQAPSTGRVAIEATAAGWWYCANLPDGRLAATFMTDSDLIDDPAVTWREQLAGSTRTRGRSMAYGAPDDVHVRPARTQRLARLAGPGWLATGDAATSYDPLSSAGIRKGLESGAAAVAALTAPHQERQAALARYEAECLARLDRYLAQRSRLYGHNRRWPEAVFWRRRQLPPAAERPILLSPTWPLSPGPAFDDDDATAALAHAFPHLHCEELHALVPTSQPAHAIVRRWASQLGSTTLDRELIAALSHAVKLRLLKRSDE